MRLARRSAGSLGAAAVQLSCYGAVALAACIFATGATGDLREGAADLSAGRAGSPVPFSLTVTQAAQIRVAMTFIAAFNARDLTAAVAQLTPTAIVSDCNYRTGRVVQFKGRQAVTTWLRQRFATHDHLTVSRVYNQNAAEPVGTLGLEYALRTSRTLRALGFPNGIVPAGATKVIFSQNQATRIAIFANGPVGGPADECRPHRP